MVGDKEILKKLDNCINKALDELYEKDYYLIKDSEDKDFHLCERSIVFRFAHYLYNLVENDVDLSFYNVDCEYNRSEFDIKRISSRLIYPDVIIHQRGNNKHNLMVIEFKGYWNNLDNEHDENKINELVNTNGVFKYKNGKTIIIEKARENVTIKQFNNIL